MNWCSIKHKWEYKKEEIFYERIFLKKSATVSTEVRLCKRCHKKQRMGISGYWIDWELTKEEQREIILNKIGI